MTQTSRPDAAAAPERQRDKERTRQEILDVAIREFARNGYSGARVDEIAARTRTTKRMIYYYFGGKEQLYIAALEQAYSTARDAERQLDVEHLDPVAAIRRLAELTFDHHESASGLHQHGRDREHPPGRVHRQVQGAERAEHARGVGDRPDPGPTAAAAASSSATSTPSTCTC